MTAGKERGHPDADTIQAAIDEGWVRIVEPSQNALERVEEVEIRAGIRLDAGERAALATALQEGESQLLTDDEDANLVASNLELNVNGSPAILITAVRKEKLNRKQARQALDTMLEKGFWLSTRMVQQFNEALEEIAP